MKVPKPNVDATVLVNELRKTHPEIPPPSNVTDLKVTTEPGRPPRLEMTVVVEVGLDELNAALNVASNDER